MIKLLLSVALFTSQVYILTATICNNPLALTAGFSGPDTAALVPDLKYCKSLKNVESCCNADSFNNIPTKIQSLLDNLHQTVSERDIALTNIRLKVLPRMADPMRRLGDAIKKIIESSGGDPKALHTVLESMINGAVNSTMNDTEPGNSTNNTGMMVHMLNKMKELNDRVPRLKDNFMGYQQNRTKCIVQMAKLQGAIWCLACDPNYGTKGVANDGTITLSDTTKAKLMNACYDYFTGTEEQSALADLQQLAPVMEGFASAMEKMGNNEIHHGAMDFMSAEQKAAALPPPPRNAEKPAKKPPACTRDGCDFLWDQVFRGGQLNVGLLGNGGQFDDGSSTDSTSTTTPPPPTPHHRRLLGEGRILVGFDLDDDEAGVSISFQDDPGNANSMTASASLLGGVLVVGALLVTLF